MFRMIHPLAGAVATLTIATFWLSTVLSELFGSREMIVAVKSAIPWGFLLLIPAMAAAGGSGFKLAGSQRAGLSAAKAKRMPLIAANGLLVLIPSALYLASKANAGAFDTSFYTVQALELLAGATNLTLLGLNMRDGLRLTGKLSGPGTATHEVKLLAREEIAEGTLALRLSKPNGFTYRAGQHVTLRLVGNSATDNRGNTRVLTLASAPHEPQLLVATRLRETTFKRALHTMPIGSGLAIAGPGGDMTLHADTARPAVFIADGIGITPFLAMAREAAHATLPRSLTLFYSNRRPTDAAFLGELQRLAETSPNFRLVATMTSPDAASPWQGETGMIGPGMLRRHVPDVLAPVYYLAGPATMVTAMLDMLTKLGVAKADVHFEHFYGN